MSSQATASLLKDRFEAADQNLDDRINRMIDAMIKSIKLRHSDFEETPELRERLRSEIELRMRAASN